MPIVVRRGRTKNATDWLLSQVTVADEQPCESRISDLWTCKYSPQSESELAVHGDKLKELTSVVQCCLTTKRVNHRGGPVLLLCGPPGSGKISSLKIAVQTIFPHGNIQWMEWLDESLGSDEITQLEEFVKQSCRYQIVTEKLTDMNCVNEPSFVITVLKNLPVSLTDCASRFHSLLRFHATNASPSSLLVVSCTSSSSSRESLLSERILCPISLRSELNISRVEFNPVAPTLLLKALNRIVKQEHVSYEMLARATVSVVTQERTLRE
ncbi:putative Cell cycle checkpoint protein rad17 [Fasciola gigantica]|uniref:Putative Cell cycle checkpoint protein rad17 n=1 Tax=Fasciola gigantica TaxID=46835 RepID=A0A504YQ85_FASGI|nr:putative Cell cycle checkpoint protein rad17 [Fasciola gigantica]